MTSRVLVLGILAVLVVLATVSPSAATAPAFRTYVACGVAPAAKPSHVCAKAAKKGAFFRSNAADVEYKICIRFPTGTRLCAARQPAEKGVLKINPITSTTAGEHRVTWVVEGRTVGTFNFTVTR